MKCADPGCPGSLIELINADTDLPAAGRIDVALGEKRTKYAYQFDEESIF
ncbi:MAG: hypothetical protein K9H64_02500 [Bacteroidales bacterium]|nr:hypothetical protein [Bacteroidales bacterium]MCF8454891.1 hypothetical protein [Bacteroidales bacterium]